MTDENARNDKERMFLTTFDGDEIDGKVYGLGQPFKGLDNPTAEYLKKAGRVEELTEEAYEAAVEAWERDHPAGGEASAETGAERAEREEREAARQAAEETERKLFAEALAEVKGGKVPEDLKGDGPDGIMARGDLEKVAANEKVTLKSSWQKPEVVAALMVARDKAKAETGAGS